MLSLDAIICLYHRTFNLRTRSYPKGHRTSFSLAADALSAYSADCNTL